MNSTHSDDDNGTLADPWLRVDKKEAKWPDVPTIFGLKFLHVLLVWSARCLVCKMWSIWYSGGFWRFIILTCNIFNRPVFICIVVYLSKQFWEHSNQYPIGNTCGWPSNPNSRQKSKLNLKHFKLQIWNQYFHMS